MIDKIARKITEAMIPAGFLEAIPNPNEPNTNISPRPKVAVKKATIRPMTPHAIEPQNIMFWFFVNDFEASGLCWFAGWDVGPYC